MEFKHKTVLLNETVNSLNIKPDGIYVDGTMGGGGHSKLILESIKTGKLIGIDQDAEAIENCRKNLQYALDKIIFVQDNFKNVKSVLHNLSIDKIDGAVMDLGVSSYQIDNPDRGFSYMQDSYLDMRMNRQSSFSAYDVVNEYSVDDLTRILYEYGEEKFAAKIARNIVSFRKNQPIKTTGTLVNKISDSIPNASKIKGSHPAKRTFQAIRIEVNNELKILENTINDFFEKLNVGGRISIITFHSLEDRIVKNTFARLCEGCTCPPKFPVCVCGKEPKAKLVNKKPILPSYEEITENRRSKSAKLRTIQKIR